MNLFDSVNNRRLACGVPVKKLQEVNGWNSKNTYYGKIESIDKIWSLEEIINLLNLLKCTFEELFIEGNFLEGRQPKTYWIAKNLLRRILYFSKRKGVDRLALYEAMGGKCSRQNFYKRIQSEKFRLFQIFNLLILLDVKFDELFLEEIKFTILPDNLNIMEEGVI